MRRFMLAIVSIPSGGALKDVANIGKVTTGKVLSLDELSQVQGRAWEDVDVSTFFHFTKETDD